MFKQVIILCISLGLLSTTTFAAPGGSRIERAPLHDTIYKKKDSLLQSTIKLSDPKEGFKDLFAATASDDQDLSINELNPMAISFVEDYIEKYGKKMEEMKTSARPYFDVIDAVLTQHGLPKELKYLAVIESYLQTNAKSYAGAVGAWQFMPVTARNMGLKVGRHIDERRDLFKSTHAASKYLAGLFELYEDWLLVIAAYNCGAGNVNAAIKKSGSRDFWVLQNYLPAQSRNHVKKFIATHYIMEGAGGITTLSKKETDELLFPTDSLSVAESSAALTQAISGRYNSGIIVKYLSMDLPAFNKLNPKFDNIIADNGKYDLRLPADKMDIFIAKKTEILKESLQLLRSSARASR